MARWSAEVSIRPPDVALIRAAIPVAVDRLRTLRFDAAEASTGRGLSAPLGLAVMGGRHPRPGVTYHVVATTDQGRYLYEARLLDDSRHRFALGVQSFDRREGSAVLEIAEPARPTEITLDTETEVARRGQMQGPMRTRLVLDPTFTPFGPREVTVASLGFAHTAVKGRVMLDALPLGAGGRQTIRISVRARGRWIWRPIGWFGWWTLGWLARRQLRDAVDRIPELLQQVDDVTARHPTPELLADFVVGQMFALLGEPRRDDDPPYRNGRSAFPPTRPG